MDWPGHHGYVTRMDAILHVQELSLIENRDLYIFLQLHHRVSNLSCSS